MTHTTLFLQRFTTASLIAAVSIFTNFGCLNPTFAQTPEINKDESSISTDASDLGEPLTCGLTAPNDCGTGYGITHDTLEIEPIEVDKSALCDTPQDVVLFCFQI
ncbi:hypothetical protein [Calothrix sp. PCC 7507]|uniref:hypothetical protein n=1 Tax=Calothrix sp. PCC 7507 TaxID=99598 RepID=UPI00029F35BC|nr:hypothetical protein [Calothrix sp. PCC 7507]AFY34370.1 hypothetical protein Cal7507_3984 [Calothrix sp. PCC 7507]